MTKIELIYDKDCPNVERARANIDAALRNVGINSTWIEWDRNSASSPEYAGKFGSPTILVDGCDVSTQDATSDATCCRVYFDDNQKLSGVPSVETIVSTVNKAREKNPTYGVGEQRANTKGVITAVLSGLVALLPAIFCPACWGAYAALLSSLGVGFFNYTPFLLPVMMLLLLLNLVFLCLEARRKKRYSALTLGGVATVTIIVAKFVLELQWLLYVGVAGLIFASIWNLTFVKRQRVCCLDNN